MDSDDVGVGWVSIDGEAVADILHAVRDSAKAVNGEAAICIIRLYNLAHGPKSLLVLVVWNVWASVMKRIWCRMITIRHSVVNSAGERQSPSGAQVIDKGMLHVDLKIADR